MNEKVTLTLPLVQIAGLYAAMGMILITNGINVLMGISALPNVGGHPVEITEAWFKGTFIFTVVILVIHIVPVPIFVGIVKAIDEKIRGIILGAASATCVAFYANMKYFMNAGPGGKLYELILDLLLSGVMLIGINRTSRPTKPSTNYMLMGAHFGVNIYLILAASSRAEVNLSFIDKIPWIPKAVIFVVAFIMLFLTASYYDDKQKYREADDVRFGYFMLLAAAFFCLGAATRNDWEEVICSAVLFATSFWTATVYFFDLKEEDLPSKKIVRAVTTS